MESNNAHKGPGYISVPFIILDSPDGTASDTHSSAYHEPIKNPALTIAAVIVPMITDTTIPITITTIK